MSASPVIPGFRVLRQLGQGGMGAVFLVEPENLPGVTRALKLMSVRDPARRERFVREAALLARVDRAPGIVRVHGAGEHQGQAWLCMEHIEGGDLASRLRRDGAFPWREAARIVRDVALGLSVVHAQGIVHRDVKPANVLLDRRGAAHLVDFGVALAADLERLTLTGALVGTPAYFSPEQAGGGGPVTGQSDVYALGVVLFELLTGELPFEADAPVATIIGAILRVPASPPSSRRAEVPPAVDAAVLAALAKAPTSRPDAAGLAALLDAALAQPHAGALRSRLSRRLRPALISSAALGASVALVALAVRVVPAPDVRAPAEREATVATRAARRAPVTESALTPLVDLIRASRHFEAAAWLRRRADLRDVEPADAHGAAELARAHVVALTRAPAPAVDEVQTLLQVAGRLRELEGAAASEPDAAIAAVLTHVKERLAVAIKGHQEVALDCVALIEAAEGAGGGRAPPVADEVLDLAFRAFVFSLLPAAEYQRVLAAMVRMDVELHYEHLVRAPMLPPEVGRGPSAEYVNLRIRAEVGYGVDERRAAAAKDLLEFVRRAEAQLGPVSRARALSIGARRAPTPEAAIALREEATALDPSSPFPYALCAARLVELGRAVDGAANAMEALARVERDERYGSREVLGAWDIPDMYRTAVRSLLAAGDLERARSTLERLAARVPAEPSLPDLREELAGRERERAGGGF